MKYCVVLFALVAAAVARQLSVEQAIKQFKLNPAVLGESSHEKVKALLLQPGEGESVREEFCSVIYHVPEGVHGHLTYVNSWNEECTVDEPTYYTYHARSGTLVVFYDEQENDQYEPGKTHTASHELTDLAIRVWTGHQFPGEKLKPSISEGCRLCKRGFVYQPAHVVEDACHEHNKVCELTGEQVHFDTVDRHGECKSARKTPHQYYCECASPITGPPAAQNEWFQCQTPLRHIALSANQRTTHHKPTSYNSYSDVSSSEWYNSEGSDSSTSQERPETSTSTSNEY
jgi:hypothetical protein